MAGSITGRLATQKRKKYIRRAFLAGLVFLVAMAQNVPWLPGIFGVLPLPLIPLVVCIAVFDQEVPGILFGAFAGILWDFSSAGLAWHAMYLTFAAFVCAMLMRYVINRNRLTITLLMLFFTFGYVTLHWVFDQLLPYFNNAHLPFNPYGGALSAYLRYCLPAVGYTMLLAPICYGLTYWIIKRTSRKQRSVYAK